MASETTTTVEVLPAEASAAEKPIENAAVAKQAEAAAEEPEEGEIVMEKTHPQLVELSRRNGQINRLNVVQMRSELRKLGLTTFGSKQVLRKRLKAAALRDILKSCTDQNVRNKLVGRNRAPRFLVVMDFEATCGEVNQAVIRPDGEGKKPKIVKKTGPTFTERLRQVRDGTGQQADESGNDKSEKTCQDGDGESRPTPATQVVIESVMPLKQLAEQAVKQLGNEEHELGTDSEPPTSRTGPGREQIQEIIEFPAYFIDTHELRIVGAPFHSFVRPSHASNRRLSQFCTELTGIVQSDVDGAPCFPDVLTSFKRWLVNKLRTNDPRVIRRFGVDGATLASEIEASMLSAACKSDVNNNTGEPPVNAQAEAALGQDQDNASSTPANKVDLNSSFLETALTHLRALQAANNIVKSIINEPEVADDGDGNDPAVANVSDQLGTLQLDSEAQDAQDDAILAHGDFAMLYDSAVDSSVFLRISAAVCGVSVPLFMREWVNLKKIYCNFYTLPKGSLTAMLRSVQLDFVGRAHRGRDDAHNIARLALRLAEDGASLCKNERLLQRPANERLGKTFKNPDQVRVRYYEPIRSDPYSRRKRESRESRDPVQRDSGSADVESEEDDLGEAQDDLLYLHALKRQVNA